MAHTASISFVILAYNDAPSLPDLVRNLNLVLSQCFDEHEIIVVDDGSNDQTAEVCRALTSSFPMLKIIRHSGNRGVGAAFSTGVHSAQYEWIGYTDGDAQYDPHDIMTFQRYMNSADVITGVRIHRADRFHRRWISKIYNILLNYAFGLQLMDVNSALKIYRNRVLQSAFPLLSKGPFYDAEVLIKNKAAGYRILEIPIHHLPRKYGTSHGISFSSIQNTLHSMVKAEFRPYIANGLMPPGILRLLFMVDWFLTFCHKRSRKVTRDNQTATAI